MNFLFIKSPTFAIFYWILLSIFSKWTPKLFCLFPTFQENFSSVIVVGGFRIVAWKEMESFPLISLLVHRNMLSCPCFSRIFFIFHEHVTKLFIFLLMMSIKCNEPTAAEVVERENEKNLLETLLMMEQMRVWTDDTTHTRQEDEHFSSIRKKADCLTDFSLSLLNLALFYDKPWKNSEKIMIE